MTTGLLRQRTQCAWDGGNHTPAVPPENWIYVHYEDVRLERIGLARRADVLDRKVVRIPTADPAYFDE